MQEDLSKRQDPRNKLERRRRIELWTYARNHGLDKPEAGADRIVEGMPAKLMRTRLMRRGIYDLDFPMREPILGAPRGGRMPTEHVETVPALDDLERQWQAQNVKPFHDSKPKKLRIWELRKMCRDAGFKVKNMHKAHELKAMLDGKDAPERG